MMDWLGGAYGGIKAATDITQSMLTLKTDAAVTSKVVELNGVLLGLQAQLNAAHAEHTTLTERIRGLEQTLNELQAWDQEKQRYQLRVTSVGGYLYALLPEHQGNEPAHDICASCYENRRKSILQPTTHFAGCTRKICPACDADVYIDRVQRTPTKTPRRVR